MPYNRLLKSGVLDRVGLAEQIIHNIAVNDGAVGLVEVRLYLIISPAHSYQVSQGCQNRINSLSAIVHWC